MSPRNSEDSGQNGRKVRLLFSVGFAVCCFLLCTCHTERHDSTPSARGSKPVLSADPNPVPAGNFDQPLGTTVISWNTETAIPGDLYVKVNRSPEVFLARARSGTLKVGWIQFDSTYEFRLYAKKHSKLLTKLDVTRNN